jgi:hypothetical protein
MFPRHKTVDFRTINIRVGEFSGRKIKNNYKFIIKDLWIENVPQQEKELTAVKVFFNVGDSIEIDTYFGWWDGHEWLTFPLKGRFRVLGIDADTEYQEIQLFINPIRLKFRSGTDTIR